jgi:hypothetical protein
MSSLSLTYTLCGCMQLAARGALRAGVGICALGVPFAHHVALAASLPEVVLPPLAEHVKDADKCLTAEGAMNAMAGLVDVLMACSYRACLYSNTFVEASTRCQGQIGAHRTGHARRK